MTLKRLAKVKAECKAAGWDVDAMESSDLFAADVPRWVRDVLHYDLVRRWSETRAFELAAAG